MKLRKIRSLRGAWGHLRPNSPMRIFLRFPLVGEKYKMNPNPEFINIYSLFLVPTGNRISLEVPWQNGGINPETKEHAQYLDNLCEKYNSVVKETVNKLIDQKTTEHEHQLVEAKNCGMKIHPYLVATKMILWSFYIGCTC